MLFGGALVCIAVAVVVGMTLYLGTVARIERVESLTKRDYARLQGRWWLISRTRAAGTAKPSDDELFIFDGHCVTWITDFHVELFFCLDLTQTPPSIRLYPAERPDLLQYHGIYRVDGQHLLIALAGPQETLPSSFSPQEGDQWFVLELHRVNPGPEMADAKGLNER
jgi:uncharacterized protein (TIGR03067 family)